MNITALTRATGVGAVLQLIMIVLGHFIPFVRDQVFMWGGLALSLLAGLIYARKAAAGWGSSLGGGAIAGGVCALIGIAASVLLKDTNPEILGLGTAGSAVTGLMGGAVGKLLK